MMSHKCLQNVGKSRLLSFETQFSWGVLFGQPEISVKVPLYYMSSEDWVDHNNESLKWSIGNRKKVNRRGSNSDVKV